MPDTQDALAGGGQTGAQTPPTSSTPGPTEYVVLLATDAGWTPEPTSQTARSADAAVKQAAEARMKAGGDPNGMYVAVPSRSWRPTPVKVETAFKIGGQS